MASARVSPGSVTSRASRRFLDEIALPASELEARFPLSEHLWLSAVEACRVTASDTVTMVRSGDPWAGLMDFHRAALDELARVQEREARQRWSELKSTMAGERLLVGGASIKLSAVANETTVPMERTAGDTLLAACRAVGQELGLDVRPPRKSSDDDRPAGSETLEEIARASGFHVRQVTLPQDWAWDQSGEPLLAHLEGEDNRPVALLPGRDRGKGRFASRGYDLYDPVADSRQPVNETQAHQVGPTAWMFYRTLPDHPLRLLDLLHLILPRIRGEIRVVVALAIIAGLLGLAVPIGAGVLVDQVIPEVDLPDMGWARLLVFCCLPVRPGSYHCDPSGGGGAGRCSGSRARLCRPSSPRSGIACSDCRRDSSAGSPRETWRCGPWA